MRVLHLISSAGYYGAEAFVYTLAGGLRSSGVEVCVGVFLNRHAPNIELGEKANKAGFPVHFVECRGKWDWQAVGGLRAYIQDEHIDILHTHGYKADVYGYLAARNTSAGLISTCHNWIDTNVSLWLYNVVDRICLRGFDGVAAVSDEVLSKLNKVGLTSKVRLIDNGVDISRFADQRPALREELSAGSKSIVGMVGRLSSEKRPSNFIRAASLVLHNYPDCLFIMVGDGPDRQALEALARQLGIQRQVRFTGYRHDMAAVYASLDVLVLPSINEGMPMTVIEAMAAGVAVIASCVGSIPKLIQDQNTGLLVEPDDVASLAAAIGKVLCDDGLRQSYGSAAKRLVSKCYSAEVMSSKYLALYADVLKQKVKTQVGSDTVFSAAQKL